MNEPTQTVLRPRGNLHLSRRLYGTAPGLHLGGKATVLQSTDIGERNGHPVPKPIRWMRWLLNLAARDGETVLDPYMGSGPVARACKDAGLSYVGIEIVEKYCEIAVKRLAQEVLF